MNRTGLVYTPEYLKHETGQHVEVGDRLTTAHALLQEKGMLAELTPIAPEPATPEQLDMVHGRAYQQQVRDYAAQGGGLLDPDTVVSPASFDVALLSAGGALAATRAVLAGEVDNAFALIRPPGHHALPNRSMGFCLFNNVALAARYAQQQHGVDRVLILDWDVHHGNGTQDIFYKDPTVMFVSWHQEPNWPGTGAVEELGEDAGRGYTVNIPFRIGTGFVGFSAAFDQVVAPIARAFRPGLILVSCGYDAHWRDPIGRLGLSVSGYANLTRKTVKLADELCGGKLVLLLEGGYNLQAVAHSILGTVQVLRDPDAQVEDPWGDLPQATMNLEFASTIDRVARVHQEFWPVTVMP